MSHKDDINVLSGRLHRIIGMLCELEEDLGIIYDELGVQERTCKRITLGLEREREVATVSWICSACGKHINKDHEYCYNCGAKVVNE